MKSVLIIFVALSGMAANGTQVTPANCSMNTSPLTASTAVKRSVAKAPTVSDKSQAIKAKGMR